LMAGSGLVFKSRGTLGGEDLLGEWQLHSAEERSQRHRSSPPPPTHDDRASGTPKKPEERTA
jgi:hypothetical protein